MGAPCTRALGCRDGVSRSDEVQQMILERTRYPAENRLTKSIAYDRLNFFQFVCYTVSYIQFVEQKLVLCP